MDENYLDNLLNEFSLDNEIDNKIEDELDSQIAKEKQQHQTENTPSQEELFDMDLNQDASEGLLDKDLSFSEEQMDELDALDDLADLDIGDLDFSDIDFDDLDITKLDDVDTSDLEGLLKDFEGDLEVDHAFQDLDVTNEAASSRNGLQEETFMGESTVPQQDNLNEDSFNTDEFLDDLINAQDEKKSEETPIIELQEGMENVTFSSDADASNDASADDLDALLDALGEEESVYQPMDETKGDFNQAENTGTTEPSADVLGSGELSSDIPSFGDDLDDLFSLLDMNEDSSKEAESLQDIPLEMSEEESASDRNQSGQPATKKKQNRKSLIDILFGEDEEELSEEQIAQLELKKAEEKAEKKAKKQAEKEAKKEQAEAAKAEKTQKQTQKKKENAEKQKVKAQKRAKKRAEEDAEPEKKLNSAMVMFVFTLFLGGTLLFYLASNNFNYTMAINNATNYFESQKYHRAYDEIKGVEVKEKDQDLKDRIYTVMYVERLYESYENNIQLGFYDKSLDALLRGVDKYYEHYDEAVELGIVSDVDYSYSRIQEALMNNFGISEDEAKMLNDLDDDEYVLRIRSYVEANEGKLISDTPSQEASSETETTQPEDANTNQEQNASEE